MHRAIDEGWISGTGPQVILLEQAVGQHFTRHATACANGTLALEAVLRTLNVGAGDTVLCPALTFVSPAAAIRAVGATVRFVDIDPVSWTIDPYALPQDMLARAIIAVDLLGHPCDYDSLLERKLPETIIIEDAAEAHGAQYKGVECGSFGFAATFSLYPNKAVTAGEGGLILTNWRWAQERIQLQVHHGMKAERPYYHEIIGSNYRMSNLNAALALAQVERWDELVAARRQIATWYHEELPEEFIRRPVASWATEGTWLVAVSHADRDALLPHIRASGVDARALWPIIPSNPPYRDGRDYPVAERVSREAFLLPTFGTMTRDDVRHISTILAQALMKVTT